MANIIDSRGFQLVPDITPFANGIGNLVSQRIAERLAQQAQGGDQQAMSQLAVRDPRAAYAIGNILQDQQAEQQSRQALNQDMAYRVARGYLTAKDKAGFLASASQQLRQGGFEDLAKHVDDDIATLAQNPAQVDTEYQSLHDMLDPMMKSGAEFQDFQSTAKAAGLQPGTDEYSNAARIKLGLNPRAVGSAAMTIANTGQTGTVAQSESQIEGAKAGAKEAATLNVQGQLKPGVEAAVTAAQKGAEAGVARTAKEGSSARDEREVDRLLTKAESELDTATGSYAGRGFDYLARAVGIATKGSISATKLKALEAALVLKMPRMEGPQSDRDAALYKQAAGLIGDATVPAEERKSALETIRFINSRYTGDNAPKGSAQSPAKTNTGAQQPSIDDLVNKYAQ